MQISLKGWLCEIVLKDGKKEIPCFSIDRDGNVTQHIDPDVWDHHANKMMEHTGQRMSRYYTNQATLNIGEIRSKQDHRSDGQR